MKKNLAGEYKEFLNRNKRKRIFIPLLVLIILIIASPFILEASYYLKAEFEAAHKKRYGEINSNGNYIYRNRKINEINLIVIHVADGYYNSTINMFKQPPGRLASAHYMVGKRGDIVSMVHDEKIAWHAGNWEYNKKSIGVEHEGFSTLNKKYCLNRKYKFSEKMYLESAKLTRYLVSKWKIPPRHISGIGKSNPNRNSGILGHNQIPDPKNSSKSGGINHHFDPGNCWNWSYYMNLVRGGGKPDLYIKYFNVLTPKFLPGGTVDIKTRVINQGRGDTIGDFYVYLYLDNKKIASKKVAPLNKGKGLNKLFSFEWPQDNKNHTLQVKIKDKYNYILETNFSNNASEKIKRKAKANNKPVATILSVDPLEAILGEKVTFKGEGDSKDDELGDEIVNYRWASSIDGGLSTKKIFSSENLSEGEHTISFRVKDKFKWSNPAQAEVNIIDEEDKGEENDPPIIATNFNKAGKVLYNPQTIKLLIEDESEVAKVKYCTEKKCKPSKILKAPYKKRFKNAKDVFFRIKAIDEFGNASKIKEIKFKLRRYDINENGRVGKRDLSKMMACWKKRGFSVCDLNGDRIVNKRDLSMLMAHWGEKY